DRRTTRDDGNAHRHSTRRRGDDPDLLRARGRAGAAMKRPVNSRKLFARASQILPGGVDSPVRAFSPVGGAPLFIRRASGAILYDVDGNAFIDYVMSWGPMLHGHAPSGQVRA